MNGTSTRPSSAIILLSPEPFTFVPYTTCARCA